jgi:hypothetical protein
MHITLLLEQILIQTSQGLELETVEDLTSLTDQVQRDMVEV